MRIAIVHDDLVQWGGAERVLLGLCEIFPNAPIYTSLYDSTNVVLKRNFGSKKIITSFLQKIPGWRFLYKALLPFYSVAFEQFDFSEFNLVISHTTRFAKSIVTKPATTHICYLHTPPRFLWHFSGEKDYGLAEFLLTKLRIYDQVSARRVDFFLAGSENAKKRIKKVYKRESKVVYPFVDLERFKGVESFDGGYFVVMGRSSRYKQSLRSDDLKQSLRSDDLKQSLRSDDLKQSLKFSLRSNYKRFDLAISACHDLGLPLKVIGGTGDVGEIRGVEFLGQLSDQMVVNVLAGCKALIVPGIEDFGLTSLEAQALGKPVVAFAEGGALETVIPNKTGIFFDKQTTNSLRDTLLRLDKLKIKSEDCIRNAGNFSKENFIRNFKQTVASLLYT